ncbi:hypothetical protein H6F96_20385 [Microcoleus sp. FACHB-53]|nr:hypothetical protein [Microcoleus sp. FACHB-53]
MTKFADWVNRHERIATTLAMYAGSAIGRYGNLTGDRNERSNRNRLQGCGEMAVFVRH